MGLALKKLRVGIIGTGMAFEKLHYPAYQELSNEYQIVALADVDQFKTKEWAGRLGIAADHTYQDYHQLLQNSEIDVFDIMVPIEQNYKVTEEVARAIAGSAKGIICEKPLAPTLEQAEAHRDLPRRYKVPIMIAENYRYNEDPNLIRDLVRTGRIGTAYYFVWNRVLNFPADLRSESKFPTREWRQHPEFPGGVFYDTAVHDLAALHHIFGAIGQVQAFGQRKDKTLDQLAVVNLNLLFKSGFTGQYTFFCAGKEMQRPLVGLRIFGDQGMIYQEERDCGVINLSLADGTSEQISYRPQRGYYNELLNFYKAMNGQEPIAVTPELEYGDAKAILAALHSFEQGTIETVDEKLSYQPDYQQVERPRTLM